MVLEDPFAANMLAMRLDSCQLDQMLPTWDSHSPSVLREQLGATDGVLVVGAPTPQLVSYLPGVTWAVPSRPLFENLVRALGPAAAKLTMACHCDEPTAGRDKVILTDLVRMLPPKVQLAQLTEALRVGRSAYFVTVDRFAGLSEQSAVHRELGSWSISPIESLIETAAAAGVLFTEVTHKSSSLGIYALSACLPAFTP